jgi:hypothetical protein
MYNANAGHARDMLARTMRLTFWDMMIDSEWRRRRDINSLQEGTSQLANELSTIEASSSAMYRRVQELSVAVGILAQMLQESGHLDVAVLKQRMDAAMSGLHTPATPLPDPWHAKPVDTAATPVVGDPYRSTPPPAEAVVRCTRCMRTVPERLTVITTNGTICDVCAAK